ncbi:MAG TPA: twin-arginine translocase subunit TatC [Longimicrobiales bacterium]|nr:twin-arginine translocase subunit TatC [Longimicrobiales bacterium]
MRRRIPRPATAAGDMPFLDHLEELRWRILYALIALVIGAIAGFILVTEFDVLGLLIAPVEPYLGEGQRLAYLSPTDPFFITLKLALLVGLLLSAPVMIYQGWAFLSPALHREERRAIVPSFYLGLVLFTVGAALAYWAALPVTLRFMMGFQVESLEQNLTVGPYLSLVVRMLLAFGLVFELPIVILILSAFGIVDPAMLRSKRRHAIVLIAVVASVITPGDVVLLTLFLMVPLILLYELSIGLSGLMERRRVRLRREMLAEAADA